MRDKLGNLLGSIFAGKEKKAAETSAVEAPAEPPVVDDLVGTIYRGYQVEELLGKGAQGRVYRVTRVDEPKSGDYALKFCARSAPEIEEELNDPNLPEWQKEGVERRLNLALSEDKRFAREMATLTTKLDHPNVIKPIDYGSDELNHWVVMPYLGKVSLDDRLASGKLEGKEFLKIFGDIVTGLQVVHDRGIVHRDLKPQNVMLADGKAIIIDFGLVKGKDDKTFTTPGAVLGSTNYIAPEQINFKEPQNEKTDQFALGAMIYFSLSGTFPYLIKGLHSLMMRDQCEYDNLSKHRAELNSEVGNVLEKMMAKTQGERYTKVSEAFAAFVDAYKTE